MIVQRGDDLTLTKLELALRITRARFMLLVLAMGALAFAAWTLLEVRDLLEANASMDPEQQVVIGEESVSAGELGHVYEFMGNVAAGSLGLLGVFLVAMFLLAREHPVRSQTLAIVAVLVVSAFNLVANPAFMRVPVLGFMTLLAVLAMFVIISVLGIRAARIQLARRQAPPHTEGVY